MSTFPSSALIRVAMALLLALPGSSVLSAAAWERVWNTNDASVDCLAVGDAYAYAWASLPLLAIGRSSGGAVWSTLPSEPTQLVVSIRVDPNDPERAWMAATGAIRAKSGAFVSEDAGRTFTPLPLPVSYWAITDVTPLPGSPDTLLLGTAVDDWGDLTSPGGVFRSTDRGLTWTAVGLQGLNVGVFFVDPHDPAVIYAIGSPPGREGRTAEYRSEDGGKTWHTFASTMLLDFQVDRHDSRRMMAHQSAMGWDYLVRTDDGGASWRVQWTEPLISESSGNLPVVISALRADPVHPGVLYVGTLFHGVHRSTNDGATWEPIGLENISINELAIDSTTGFLYAATAPRSGLANAGVYRLTNPSGDPTLLPWFTMDRDTVPLGISITFTDDTRGTVVTRTWDFGDGTSSAEAAPVHAYARGGTFSVVLAVSDATETKSIRRTVVVEPTRARPVRRGNASIGRSADTAVPSTDLID
jgi:hypothetical protein